MKSFFSGYKGPARIVRRYWAAYGGWTALARSPYLHIAILSTAILYPSWLRPGWWDTVISVAPGLIGFSLGGYAIWLAFGDSDFRDIISGTDSDDEVSPYMEVNSAFVHFIMMQIAALIIALAAQAFIPEDCAQLSAAHKGLSFLGYGMFMYAILCAIAATFAVLRVASWYDEYQSRRRRNNSN